MVKAGVYLVARMAPMFAMTGNWRLVVMVIGASTMVIGGLRALRQYDLKLLLAYGTVSQLGFMMLLLGVGEYHIAEAGLVLILAHAAFKAALFMVVGIVDHETGTRVTSPHCTASDRRGDSCRSLPWSVPRRWRASRRSSVSSPRRRRSTATSSTVTSPGPLPCWW